MKKTITALLFAFTLTGLTACGGKNSNTTVDVAKVAEELSATVTSDSLSPLSNNMYASIYFTTADQIVDGSAYLSSGATACEVAVMECKDKDSMNAVKTLFEKRVENQKALYETYNTTEADRLDTALVESNGNYVALCVSEDAAAAEKILEENGFK